MRKAKRKGLSIGGIAREVGIHRDTVRKYMNAESRPKSRAQRRKYHDLLAWQTTEVKISLDT